MNSFSFTHLLTMRGIIRLGVFTYGLRVAYGGLLTSLFPAGSTSSSPNSLVGNIASSLAANVPIAFSNDASKSSSDGFLVTDGSRPEDAPPSYGLLQNVKQIASSVDQLLVDPGVSFLENVLHSRSAQTDTAPALEQTTGDVLDPVTEAAVQQFSSETADAIMSTLLDDDSIYSPAAIAAATGDTTTNVLADLSRTRSQVENYLQVLAKSLLTSNQVVSSQYLVSRVQAEFSAAISFSAYYSFLYSRHQVQISRIIVCSLVRLSFTVTVRLAFTSSVPDYCSGIFGSGPSRQNAVLDDASLGTDTSLEAKQGSHNLRVRVADKAVTPSHELSTSVHGASSALNSPLVPPEHVRKELPVANPPVLSSVGCDETDKASGVTLTTLNNNNNTPRDATYTPADNVLRSQPAPSISNDEPPYYNFYKELPQRSVPHAVQSATADVPSLYGDKADAQRVNQNLLGRSSSQTHNAQTPSMHELSAGDLDDLNNPLNGFDINALNVLFNRSPALY